MQETKISCLIQLSFSEFLKLGQRIDRDEYLAIGGAVGVDGPASLVAESLEDLIVVAVLGERVVPVEAESGEHLGGVRPPPPFTALVVLPLLPRRRPRPSRHPSAGNRLVRFVADP